MNNDRKKFLKNKKVVVKIGTKVLLSHSKDSSKVKEFIEQIATEKLNGAKFIIVSSGAVGFGMESLNLEKRPTQLQNVQALAAIGQNILMKKWHDLFSPFGIETAQILFTYDVVENRKRFLHARDCLEAIFNYGVIPIVNENDSVAVDELKFGENDTLSALTALISDADILILYTDTDGLYTKNPHKYHDAQRIPYIKEIDKSIMSLIDDASSEFSRGGMETKINAARLAADSGIPVVIADGRNPRLKEILRGDDIGTFVEPSEASVKLKKRWIFSNRRIAGKIFVDDGAEDALVKKRKSLLPSGIVGVEGQFEQGHIVGIYNNAHKLIAKGITYYSSSDINRMKGKKTCEIKDICKTNYYDEVIDRNNMFITLKNEET